MLPTVELEGCEKKIYQEYRPTKRRRTAKLSERWEYYFWQCKQQANSHDDDMNGEYQ